MGFNTNMKMIECAFEEEGRAIQYEITFKNRKLQTTSAPLSDFKADFFMGRATRVFKVTERERPAFALRMSWLPLGSKMEHERLQELQEALKALGPNQPQNLDPTRYWLTVKLCGYNTFKHGSEEVLDSTKLFAREDFEAKQFYPGYTELKEVIPLNTLTGNSHNHSTGHVHEAKLPGSDSGLLDSPYTGDAKSFYDLHNGPRVHYLIGYKEICEPLHNLTLLHEIYFVLADAVYGEILC